MGEELGNYVHQNMGEELGNYVHQNLTPNEVVRPHCGMCSRHPGLKSLEACAPQLKCTFAHLAQELNCSSKYPRFRVHCPLSTVHARYLKQHRSALSTPYAASRGRVCAPLRNGLAQHSERSKQALTCDPSATIYLRDWQSGIARASFRTPLSSPFVVRCNQAPRSSFGTDRQTHHTVHANPPVEFRDRQTDRVISGQTDTHITLSTPTPRSSFGTDRDSLYGGGAR